MKNLFLLFTMFAAMAVKPAPAQENANTAQALLLPLYYEIKDALVAGNGSAAAAKAASFVKALSGLDNKWAGEENREVLLKEAGTIANSKSIADQRVSFATFSDNMIALAKKVKLSAEPVYLQYCPMKKASWLSSQQAIRNPYYGSAMLTCGSVKATL